eukprot:SAG31_NODE_23747_length_497_cov_0.881910_1_plen_89_part_10
MVTALPLMLLLPGAPPAEITLCAAPDALAFTQTPTANRAVPLELSKVIGGGGRPGCLVIDGAGDCAGYGRCHCTICMLSGAPHAFAVAE